MLTIIHLLFNILIFFIIDKIGFNLNSADFIFMLASNLIDLDHLRSKPIFKPGRNSFKTHLLHKQWKLVTVLSFIILFIRPISFLGLGILLHFLLDILDNKMHNCRK
jgi:hypothetical protein